MTIVQIGTEEYSIFIKKTATGTATSLLLQSIQLEIYIHLSQTQLLSVAIKYQLQTTPSDTDVY